MPWNMARTQWRFTATPWNPACASAIVDDLLATGGTARAADSTRGGTGRHVVGLSFLIELEFLHGRKLLQGYDVRTVVKY